MQSQLARWSAAAPRVAMVLVTLVPALACTTATPARYAAMAEDWRLSEATIRVVPGGDRLFEGVPVLERRALVQRVLERNPNLRAARQAWRAALARFPQVTSLDDPMLGAGIAPRSIGSSRVDSAPRFVLSQKLPFPGKLRLRGEVALGEAEAASHDHAAVRLRLATMASLLFDEYVLGARVLEINHTHVRLLEEFQRIATVRYEAGQASQQDPLQAEVELAHAVHRDIVLGAAFRITAQQINALLHRPTDRALPRPPSRSVVPDVPAGPPDELISEALRQRPELAAARARVTADQARVDLARREYFPDVTVTGAYNRLWQARDLQPFVGLQLNVPLRLGRRKAAVDEADARLEQAKSRRLAIEDDVRLAVRSGAERLTEARHVVRIFRDRLLPAARDQVEAARAGFESGRNSFLALIDAERNLLGVELAYEEGLADLGRRRAELDRAVGRIPGVTW